MLAEARRDGAQHVFAEAVGSCADLVATVVRPLLGSASGPIDRVSFTAMVDARLLTRLRSGEPLPWSGDVAYLFLEQLREAPLLVASKWDLVTDPSSLAASGNGPGIPVPGQTVLCQDGRTPAGVAGWVDALSDPGHPATADAGACELGIDYARYGAGEEALAWLDAEVRVDAALAGAREAVGRLVRAVVAELSDESDAIGHVKFLIRDHLYDIKVSHTAADPAAHDSLLNELRQLERLSDCQLHVVVNGPCPNWREPPAADPRPNRCDPRWTRQRRSHPFDVIPPRPTATDLTGTVRTHSHHRQVISAHDSSAAHSERRQDQLNASNSI